MTTILGKRDVDCPFSATIEMIEHLQRNDIERRVGPFSHMRARVRLELSEVRDHTDQTRIHEALVVQWKAQTWIPVPVMRGLITVRPNGLATEVRMEGEYTPPLGAFGTLFDRIIGRHIAGRTVERFLDKLHAFIEREWQRERKEYAAHTAGEIR